MNEQTTLIETVNEYFQSLQSDIVVALEELDGKEQFRKDAWVIRDPNKLTACTVHTTGADVAVERRSGDGDAPYWEVTPADETLPSLPYGGIQGMLRAVRELLGAEESGSRLVIGSRADGG